MTRLVRHTRSSGPKRQVTWVAPADQGFISVASNTKVLIATFDPAAASLIKPTLIRTRGAVSVIAESTAVDVEITGAYGLAIVSDQAVAAGIASIPGPFDDAEWDGWFVWRSFAMKIDSVTQTGVFRSSWTQEVDSKAMRKVTDNETCVVVAESQSGAFQISMPLRVLLKLS